MIGGNGEIGALWATVTEATPRLYADRCLSRSRGSMLSRQCCGSCREAPGPSLGGCFGRVSQDETWRGSRGRTHDFVRGRSSIYPLSCCVSIWPSSRAGMGGVVHARTESAEGDP